MAPAGCAAWPTRMGSSQCVARDIGASTTPHSEMYCIMYVVARSCAREELIRSVWATPVKASAISMPTVNRVRDIDLTRQRAQPHGRCADERSATRAGVMLDE